MKKPEILAPAGNMMCLKAAILAGCDAVYLGGYIFGARAFSNNFSNEEIVEAVKYAHGFGVKIYVTANTIIYENEVDTFMEYIDFLYNSNVDAVIIQDIGMMDLIRKTYPDFDVHASTQMHIHNLEGVKLVEDIGLTRAVLARETSIDIITEIKKKTNIELEIFVHGALCISYSGQCLMSSLIGNRSGNRGTCAGSCRQKYDVLDINNKKVNKESYNLSTKDLNSLSNIGKLIDANVDSLKIEGRMKSPSYVYLVTKLYREAVDSYISKGKVEIDLNKLKDLQKTFNRMFTKGFLFNTNNNDLINPYRPNHLGIEIGKVINITKNNITIKLKDDLNLNDGIRFIDDEDIGLIVTRMFKDSKPITSAKANDIITIYCNKKVHKDSIVVKTLDYMLNKDISNLLKNDSRKIEIDGYFEAKLNKKMLLSITDGTNTIEVQSNNVITESINKPSNKEQVLNQLEKTGSTIFKFTNIKISLEDNLFIPIKELNELRRIALEQLLQKRLLINREYKKYKYDIKLKDYPCNSIKSIYIDNLNQYEKIKQKDFTKIYVNQDIFNDIKKDHRVILKLPRVINKFNDFSNYLLVGELGSVRKYKDIDTDFSLNVVNSYSVALLHSLGVKSITISYEMTDEQIKYMIDAYKKRYNKNPNLCMIAYAKEEIMISKFNLLEYFNLTNKGYLRDRFNNLYKIIVRDNLMYIHNYKARNIKNIEKYYKMGINEIRYNILDEEDLKEI